MLGMTWSATLNGALDHISTHVPPRTPRVRTRPAPHHRTDRTPVRYALGILTGLTTASILHAFTRTRTYGRIVRWIWTADVRHTDPHLYGRHAR